MKAPICKPCLDTEALCAACKEKLDNKEIKQGDVDLARALRKLSSKYPALEKTEFKNTHSAEDLMVVVVPNGMAGQIIGHKGLLIKEISQSLAKRVKVVEETQDMRELAQRILFPARLLGVNIVYSGSKECFKLRVSGADKNKLGNTANFEKLFRIVLGKETNIAFE